MCLIRAGVLGLNMCLLAGWTVFLIEILFHLLSFWTPYLYSLCQISPFITTQPLLQSTWITESGSERKAWSLAHNFTSSKQCQAFKKNIDHYIANIITDAKRPLVLTVTKNCTKNFILWKFWQSDFFHFHLSFAHKLSFYTNSHFFRFSAQQWLKYVSKISRVMY